MNSTEDAPSFSFGRNWQEFLKSLDDERITIAEASLVDFLSLQDLRGRSFLDIGCGSGLFSQAAFNLHAEKVVSFDVDPFSVACCRFLHARSGKPNNWEVLEGSVLDVISSADSGRSTSCIPGGCFIIPAGCGMPYGMRLPWLDPAGTSI